MTSKRVKFVAVSAVVLLVVLGGVGVARVLFFGSSEEDAARKQTETYLSSAVKGDAQQQYDMLDSQTQGQISLADWQQKNDAAMQATGPLKVAKVTSVEIINSKQAYAAIDLTFGDNDPLPVVVPLVKEDGKWKLSLSVSEGAIDQWQHVEPTPGS
jgi:glutamate 5-kinase